MPGGGGFEIDKCVNSVVPSVCWYTTCWRKMLNRPLSMVALGSQPTRGTTFGWRVTIRRSTTVVLSVGRYVLLSIP